MDFKLAHYRGTAVLDELIAAMKLAQAPPIYTLPSGIVKQGMESLVSAAVAR